MRNRYKLIVTIILTIYLVPSLINAQIAPPISLTTLGSPYTQDFISLSNTAGSTTNVLTVQGWGLTETGGGARDNEQYAVDNGASATGDTYSYGAGATSDRALGSLRSGTLISVFGASFINNTGATITSLDISYFGEEWRLGTAARTDQLDFQYSLNATDLVTGTWTDFDGLDFLTPNIATAGAKDGNIAANRTLKSASITGLTIANGATFLIRWNDADATGADDGLAVDDFVITPQALAVGPNITAKLTDVISIDNYAPGIANPTDEITYKNTIKNSGTGTANGVTLTETTPTNTTLVPGSEVTSALARNDAYTTGFNTTLSSGNVITNDYGLPSVTVTTFGTVASMGMTTPAGSAGTTTAGGTLTVNSNGTFTYTPPIGYSGTDQFKYIATTGVVGLPNNDAIVSITVNPDITFGTALVDPLCNAGTTGSITFTGVSGGSGSGYTYSITGAAGTYFASPVFSGLAAGTYNLAVKDGAGYIKTGTATLTDPPLLSFTHMDVNNVCNAGTAGSITFTATGGTGTITYSITGAAGTYQASNIFNGLAGGTYNLAVKDANGCITTGTATLTDPAAVTFTFTKTDITCFGLNNGSIVFNTTSGGTMPYTYSITGTGGTFQPSNSFTGLTAGLKSLVAKDANGCNSAVTSSTVIEPAVIVISGTIPNLIFNVAMATATFSKTGGTGSPATPWSATGLPAGININTANGQVTGTPTVTGIFMAVITYTDANGCTDTQNANFNVAPNLQNNTFADVVGNTQLVSNDHSIPTTPFTSDATNILTNDSPGGITITAVTNAATTAGGSITIGTDGKFTYSPPNGSTADDTYVYTGTSNGVSATATISFTIANMVWYVNNSYGGANGAANGSSHRPYTFVDAAETASAANQTIYVHTGVANTAGNALLKSGQTLRGAGSALNIGTLSIAAGTKPKLSGMITVANNVNVDGFDMIMGSTTALTNAGNTVTGVTVNVGDVTASTGTGITITGAGNNVNFTLASLSTNGAPNAVLLSNTAGSVTINGGTQIGSTSSAFAINGGTVSMSYFGAITQAANAPMVIVSGGHATGTIIFQTGILSATNGTGLQFDNADGTYNFNGTNTMSGGDAGIDILNGSAGSFTFSNNTSITNPSGTAFNLNGSNASVTYSGSISDNTGLVVNIDNHDAGTMTFQNGNITSTGTGISVANCSAGTVNFNNPAINLNTGTSAAVTLNTNTGSTINFTPSAGNGLDIVTTSGAGFNATGGATAINVTGSGNTITSTTGTALNVVSTTIGAGNLNFQSISSNGSPSGIILNNTGTNGGLTVTGTGAANSGGTIQNTTGSGILATNTANLSITRMLISAPGNNGIEANGISGTCLLNNSTITAFNFANGNGLDILNNSVNLTEIRIQTCTFSNSPTGNAGVSIETSGTTNATLIVEMNSLFTGLFGDGFQAITTTGSSGTINVTVKNSTFNNGALLGNGGIFMAPFGGPVNFTFDIDGNTLENIMLPITNLGAINITDGDLDGGGPTVIGQIRNNIVNNIVGSRGIVLIADTFSGPLALTINNNTINRLQSTSKHAINVGIRNNVSGAKVTITNNSIGQAANLWTAGPGTAEAVLVLTQNDASCNTLISGNTITANAALEVLRVRAINNSTLNATVTGNTLSDINTSHIEFAAATGTGGAAGGNICLNISGNTLPAAGVGVIQISENAAPGNINVTQTDAANVATSNSGATVTVTGSPTFNQPPCTTPFLLFATGGVDIKPEVSNELLLTQALLDKRVSTAIEIWKSTGLDKKQLNFLSSLKFTLENLGSLRLGETNGNNILLDNNASENEYYIGDENDFVLFNNLISHNCGYTNEGSVAAGRIDLLTTILHEMGHALSLPDTYDINDRKNIMYGYLTNGERRLPCKKDTENLKLHNRNPVLLQD